MFSYFIHHNFNISLFSSLFPSELKKADIIPIHKKNSKFDIENYRPVSIFPVFSKICKRCMFDQMYSYFNQILSQHQCGFQQGHTTTSVWILTKSHHNISVDSDKVTPLITVFFLS